MEEWHAHTINILLHILALDSRLPDIVTLLAGLVVYTERAVVLDMAVVTCVVLPILA